MAKSIEKPLVVMIDTENKTVYLYGQFVRQFPFDEVYAIAPFLEGKDVIYVVQAEECKGEDVLDQIESLNVPVENEVVEKKFIRVNKEGYTRVPEIKANFAGPKDAKPVDTVGKDIFIKSKLMRKLLIEGSVEILTETEAKALRKPRPDMKSKDKELDSILLNRKEDAWEHSDMFTDAEEVNESTKIETDEEATIKKLGIQ